jgi:hypothetical protein
MDQMSIEKTAERAEYDEFLSDRRKARRAETIIERKTEEKYALKASEIDKMPEIDAAIQSATEKLHAFKKKWTDRYPRFFLGYHNLFRRLNALEEYLAQKAKSTSETATTDSSSDR